MGFSFQIAGQMSGLARTEESANAFALWYRDGEPVPGRLERESRDVLEPDRAALLARFPYSEIDLKILGLV